MKDREIHSSLTAPLKTDKETLGTLCAHFRQARAFTEDDVRLLSLIASQTAIAYAEAGQAVMIGEFDGVHLGHRQVIAGNDTVLTFEPHPLQVVRPEAAPKLLTSLEAKTELIAEQAKPIPLEQAKAREEIVSVLGDDLSTLKPGSPAAMRLKDALVKAGAWSQYLEVGIGPDAGHRLIAGGQHDAGVGASRQSGHGLRRPQLDRRAGQRGERPGRCAAVGMRWRPAGQTSTAEAAGAPVPATIRVERSGSMATTRGPPSLTSRSTT